MFINDKLCCSLNLNNPNDKLFAFRTRIVKSCGQSGSSSTTRTMVYVQGNNTETFSSSSRPVATVSAPTSKSSESSQKSPSDFANAVLKHHNELRRKHNVSDLQLDSNLMAAAQNWANQLAREDQFYHNPNAKYGENLYCSWNSDPNAKVDPRGACQSWYDEIKHYTFGVEPRGVSQIGHFTQVVWKKSQRLGVGYAKSRSGKMLVVCTYDPRGNYMGEFNANVNRPR